jgi:hypothetical protein
MFALLNLPFAMSIDTSSAVSLSPFFSFCKKREKESAEDFKATFGENWREESTSLFNLFSDEFREIPLRIRTYNNLRR